VQVILLHPFSYRGVHTVSRVKIYHHSHLKELSLTLWAVTNEGFSWKWGPDQHLWCPQNKMTNSLPPQRHVARRGLDLQPPQHKFSVNDPAQIVQRIRSVVEAMTDRFLALPTTHNTTPAIVVQTHEQSLRIVLDDAFVIAKRALLQPFEAGSCELLFSLHAFVEHQELLG